MPLLKPPRDLLYNGKPVTPDDEVMVSDHDTPLRISQGWVEVKTKAKKGSDK